MPPLLDYAARCGDENEGEERKQTPNSHFRPFPLFPIHLPSPARVKSHSFIVLSRLPEAKYLPFG